MSDTAMMFDLEKEALDLLEKRGSGKWDHRFVFWSGGSDSTIALHLSLRSWKEFETVFIDTGITVPETLDYIQKVSSEWDLNLTVLRPETEFWSYVSWAGFPIITALWCRRLLKMAPIKELHRKRRGWKIQALGIRRAESYRRRMFYKRNFMRHSRLKFTYQVYPILEWTDRETRTYIDHHDIPRNPSYDYYGTSGCYFCPFVSNQRLYLSLKKRHPDLFMNIVNAEGKMRAGTAWPGKSIIPVLNQQFVDDWIAS